MSGDYLPIPPSRRKKPMTKQQLQKLQSQYAQASGDVSDIHAAEEAERQRQKDDTDGLLGIYDV